MKFVVDGEGNPLAIMDDQTFSIASFPDQDSITAYDIDENFSMNHEKRYVLVDDVLTEVDK